MPSSPEAAVGTRGSGCGVTCPTHLLLPQEAASHEHFFPCGIAAACSLLDFEHLRSESVSRPKPLASFLWVFLFCCEIYGFFFFNTNPAGWCFLTALLFH